MPTDDPEATSPRGRRHALIEGLARDVQYAVRTLRRSPGFTIIAVVTLALGVGSTTAAFSVVDTIMLRGLPYRDANRLWTIYERSDDGSLRTPSYPTFNDWQAQNASIPAVIEGMAFVRGDQVHLPGHHEEVRQIGAFVSPGFFDLMGTPPLLGRTFLPDEERSGASNVAVISYDLFMQRFGGDRATLGRVVDMDGVPTTIVGVMPRAFAYPNFGGDAWIPTRLWEPITAFDAAHPGVLARRELHVDSRTVIRVRAGGGGGGGVDSTHAAAVMRTIEQRLAAAFPADQQHWTSVALQPVSSEMFGGLASALLLIAAAIALVLLLACANVANLFLVRGSARGRELAVRTALGAGRWRLVRQLLMEALLIAGIAGSLGVALAFALVGFVRHTMDAQLPFSAQLSVDGRTAIFALAASCVTALLVGLAPALQATGGPLMRRIRSGSTAAVGGTRERRVRNLLVSVQFALALTLLIGAGLLIQSFRRLVSVPLGYDPTNVIQFTVAPPAHAYDTPAAAAALYARILDAVHAVPSVQFAAAAGGALLSTSVERADEPATGQPLVQAVYHPVSTDYLRTMRISMVAGRWFTDDDMRTPMAGGFVINEKLARMMWPGSSPIGQRITVRRQSQARTDVGQPITLPVVGVTADVRQFGAAADASAEVFLPYTLEVWPWMNFVVRAPNAERLLGAVTAAVRSTDPAIEFRGDPGVMRAGAAAIDAQRRLMTAVLSGFAAGALLLAAIGLYGISAYSVTQRTREIGVRIALGASERRVVALVLRDGVTFVVLGAAAGLAGAVASTRLIRAMLFDTTATDPATFAIVTIVLAAVAVAAIYGPARRAARTDPTIAIRAE
ncbi:MAG TPA: ABC transporter permease [Gemmatimonadaceae bacterium]